MSYQFLKLARRWGALVALLCALLALTACGEDDDNDGGDDANNGAVNNSNNGDSNNGDSNNDNNGQEVIEVLGAYTDNFGGMLVVTETSWDSIYDDGMGGESVSSAALVMFDNEENFAITQSPEDDAFTPNQFGKQVWTEPGADGSFYYCTAGFGAASAEEALGAADPDSSDPANGGCGGQFPWTLVTPQ